MMEVSILCTDARHPINVPLAQWAERNATRARVQILRDRGELGDGDFLFLVSCQQIIGESVFGRFRHALVLHASALPEGRGMSPHIWQILEGRTNLTVSLLSVKAELDTGDIWMQRQVHIDPAALHEEINAAVFDAEIALMDWALEHCAHSSPRPQVGTPTYYRKRTPADSEIDPGRPLAESFDLLRVADPDRYPAFFRLRGHTYRIRIERK